MSGTSATVARLESYERNSFACAAQYDRPSREYAALDRLESQAWQVKPFPSVQFYTEFLWP